MWNSFIFAANAPALLGLLRERLPQTVDAMDTALARDARIGARSRALGELYAALPAVDFSRDIVQAPRVRSKSSQPRPAAGVTSAHRGASPKPCTARSV